MHELVWASGAGLLILGVGKNDILELARARMKVLSGLLGTLRGALCRDHFFSKRLFFPFFLPFRMWVGLPVGKNGWGELT
jgi:hypothetical protein